MKHTIRGRSIIGVAGLLVAALVLAGCAAGAGANAARSEESFVKFEECAGIDIERNSLQEFEVQFAVRDKGGTVPDLAIFPQPSPLGALRDGLIAGSAARERSIGANDILTGGVMAASVTPSTAHHVSRIVHQRLPAPSS